ncbi:MAG: hypothetical protein AAF770_02130 [Bacteroidota bacterium]
MFAINHDITWDQLGRKILCLLLFFLLPSRGYNASPTIDQKLLHALEWKLIEIKKSEELDDDELIFLRLRKAKRDSQLPGDLNKDVKEQAKAILQANQRNIKEIASRIIQKRSFNLPQPKNQIKKKNPFIIHTIHNISNHTDNISNHTDNISNHSLTTSKLTLFIRYKRLHSKYYNLYQELSNTKNDLQSIYEHDQYQKKAWLKSFQPNEIEQESLKKIEIFIVEEVNSLTKQISQEMNKVGGMPYSEFTQEILKKDEEKYQEIHTRQKHFLEEATRKKQEYEDLKKQVEKKYDVSNNKKWEPTMDIIFIVSSILFSLLLIIVTIRVLLPKIKKYYSAKYKNYYQDNSLLKKNHLNKGKKE